MDKEKIKEAAIDYSTYTDDSDDYNVTMYDAFTDGADWLMQQPLSERLTEAEKKNIINYYNPYCDEPNLYMQGVKAGLILAFGVDLFNPNQPTAI